MIEELLKQGRLLFVILVINHWNLEHAVLLQKQADDFATIKQEQLQTNQHVTELKDRIQQVYIQSNPFIRSPSARSNTQ